MSPLTAIDCPSVTRCLATDGAGRLWTTTQPLGGARGWRRTKIDRNPNDPSGIPLNGVGCFHRRLCAVGDQWGDVLVSTKPTAHGSKTWRKKFLGGGNKDGAEWAVSCPSASLCLVSDQYDAWASADPSAGHWKHVQGSGYGDPGDPFELFGSSCADAQLCFIYSAGGILYTSTNPAGGLAAWRATTLDAPDSYITGVACVPARTTCVAVDDMGRLFTARRGTAAPTP